MRLSAAPRPDRSGPRRRRESSPPRPRFRCLLQEGIGDTIRASLTPLPNGDRTEEVIVCQQILQSLDIRSFTPQVTACPGCGRTTSTFFQDMADQIQTYLREQMPVWKERYAGVEEMKVAVMGCIVNGPGESKHANIGISLPGTFEEPVAPVYVDGKLCTTCGAITSSPSSSRCSTAMLSRITPRRKSCRSVTVRVSMPRFFTLEQAQELLPRVQTSFGAGHRRQGEFSERGGLDESVHPARDDSRRIGVNREPFQQNREMQARSGERLKSAVEEVQWLGVS